MGNIIPQPLSHSFSQLTTVEISSAVIVCIPADGYSEQNSLNVSAFRGQVNMISKTGV